MEPTLSSETSAFILQTPGKFPKEHRIHSKHGESLKTTKFCTLSLSSEHEGNSPSGCTIRVQPRRENFRFLIPGCYALSTFPLLCRVLVARFEVKFRACSQIVFFFFFYESLFSTMCLIYTLFGPVLSDQYIDGTSDSNCDHPVFTTARRHKNYHN